MNKFALSGVVFATTALLAGCKFSDLSSPKVDVSQCWSQDTDKTVSQIIEPNLKTSLHTALGILGVSDAQTNELAIRLKLKYRHPVKADLDIGSVQCSASADATISTLARPVGVTLHTDDLQYSIYPGKDGAVIFASTSAFSDAFQEHLGEIAKLVRPELRPVTPTPAEQAQPAAPITEGKGIAMHGTIRIGNGTFASGVYTYIHADQAFASPCDNSTVQDVLLWNPSVGDSLILKSYADQHVILHGEFNCPMSGIQFSPNSATQP